MLEVLGYRVLIKPDPVEETTESGIVIKSDERLEKASRTTGTVVGIGPKAYKDISDGEPWVELGDRVLYAKYAGKRVIDPDTQDVTGEGEEYIVIADEDVFCKISESGVKEADRSE